MKCASTLPVKRMVGVVRSREAVINDTTVEKHIININTYIRWFK